MPLRAFLRMLSNEAEISIIAEHRLDDQSVTLDVIDQPVDEVLSAVAKRLGVALSRSGTAYYLGKFSSEDRGVLVRRVRRLSSEELSTAVGVILSDNGRCNAYDDGLVVVGDRVEVLQRVHELLDEIESAESSTWVVQLYLVSLSDRDAAELGIDVAPALELSYTYAAASSGLPFAGDLAVDLNAGLDAVLRASKSGGNVSLVAEPLFLVLDGSESRFVRGDNVPIPRRSVSDQGTVTVTGFDAVQTGLEVVTSVREISAEASSLKVDVSLSSITGYDATGEIPITAEESYSGAAVVRSGGVYLIGSLTRRSSSSDRNYGFGFGRKRADEQQLLQVWARAYRIGSDATTGRAPRSEPGGVSVPQPAMPSMVELTPSPAPPPLLFDYDPSLMFNSAPDQNPLRRPETESISAPDDTPAAPAES